MIVDLVKRGMSRAEVLAYLMEEMNIEESKARQRIAIEAGDTDGDIEGHDYGLPAPDPVFKGWK